ncbi:unnamed protein product [Rotaria sp. Silwood2]|nr:unnamed protein product [Rotaria sp. Silwood2]CAF2471265.1 unnamed protein product [Rotaria sp. Silwood2]CAF2707151.1 unnamed protein product [Rotaria sp. Silwood2]CAF3859698.1 unnamed protein product [Rotaria sp. Silwood2]CAF3900880.1 unnamed protein product [Rotaria sp. Silwood2]
MQTSNTKLIKKSELNLNDSEYNQDRNSSQDINQLTCYLKDAIFSKYISNYLIEKVEKIAIKLEEIIKYEQENIDSCKRDIEILCSSRKRLRNDDKYSVQLQSTQHPHTTYSSTRVPKTPRCIDRSDVTNDIYKDNIDELDESKSNQIINQESNKSSFLNSSHNNLRHCIFQHGEILPLDPNTKTRTIRITYKCNN